MENRGHMPFMSVFRLTCMSVGLLVSLSAEAAPDSVQASPVQVDQAWVRATVKGQKATGGFMDLTSSRALSLVGFESPAAKQAQLHEMRMDGDVMRMRELPSLELPAGSTVSLKPGALHLMLLDLKQPLQDGQTVKVVLKLRAADGKLVRQAVTVPVKLAVPASAH